MSGGRRRGWRRSAWLAPVLVAVALPACGGRSGAPLPEGPTIVDIAMDEYRYDFDTPVPAGRVVLRLRNTGQVEHRLTMVALSEDFPPIREQLRGTKRRTTTSFASIPPIKPGTTESVALDLVFGVRYGLLCFVNDPDGTSHALKGQAAEFRAGGEGARPRPAPSTTEPPDTDAEEDPEADTEAETEADAGGDTVPDTGGEPGAGVDLEGTTE